MPNDEKFAMRQFSFTLTTLMLTGALLHSTAAVAQPALRNDIGQRVLACTACHGDEGRATASGYFPRIAGKPAGYLYRQLIAFRDGGRNYPAMNAMLAHLSDDYLREIAEHFAQLRPPYPAPPRPSAPAAELARGERLAMHGDAAAKIPACIACHGANLTGVEPAIPGLLGLPRDYLNAQFGAWRTGARTAQAPDCMGQISQRLTSADISAVTAWLTSRPVPPAMAAAAPHSARLPLPCGSAPR